LKSRAGLGGIATVPVHDLPRIGRGRMGRCFHILSTLPNAAPGLLHHLLRHFLHHRRRLEPRWCPGQDHRNVPEGADREAAEEVGNGRNARDVAHALTISR
jgi:hypothetical protein